MSIEHSEIAPITIKELIEDESTLTVVKHDGTTMRFIVPSKVTKKKRSAFENFIRMFTGK